METARSTKARPPLPGGPYLIVGLARSGVAAGELLHRRGESVIGCDAGSPQSAGRLAAAGVEVHLDADGSELLERVASVIKSPGVPPTAPVIEAARKAGIPVIGELELAWRLLPNRFVAVTGTNGKTTVTELIGHIARDAGLDVAVAGNVGNPLSGLVGELGEGATVVCECSSFQLYDSDDFAPECALLLNVSPDHLDWHGTYAAYLGAKLRIFSNQTEDDVAVRERGDPELDYVPTPGDAELVEYALAAADPGGECRVRLTDEGFELDGELLIERSRLGLAGDHNARNAMAAIAAAAAIGVEREAIATGLAGFEPIPHRLEPIAEIGGVRWINDSKATNPSAALAAISAFSEPIRVILGGSLKGGEFTELGPVVAERCRGAYLIGEAAAQLAEALGPAEGAGVTVTDCVTLEAAVERVAADAEPGEVALLAPACASFDQFSDYEARGERFRELVGALG